MLTKHKIVIYLSLMGSMKICIKRLRVSKLTSVVVMSVVSDVVSVLAQPCVVWLASINQILRNRCVPAPVNHALDAWPVSTTTMRDKKSSKITKSKKNKALSKLEKLRRNVKIWLKIIVRRRNLKSWSLSYNNLNRGEKCWKRRKRERWPLRNSNASRSERLEVRKSRNNAQISNSSQKRGTSLRELLIASLFLIMIRVVMIVKKVADAETFKLAMLDA